MMIRNSGAIGSRARVGGIVIWSRRMLDRFKRALAAKGLIVYCHRNQQRLERFETINVIKSERDLLLSHVEAEQLINAIQATAPIPGEVVEVGVFRGASARLLRQYADPRKNLHVCDTFEGLPDPNPDRDAQFYRGAFATSLIEVQQYLGHEGVVYHHGRFPQSADETMLNARYSFVHLDVDLHECTL